MLYIDSSVLLEIYLAQSKQQIATGWLSRPDAKVSSWLLAIEVPIVLQRVLQSSANQQLLSQCLTRFDQDIQSISLAADFADLAARARQDGRFASCRALDAIHAGTALQLQQATNHVVHVATFDQRLADLATRLGLGLVSAS